MSFSKSPPTNVPKMTWATRLNRLRPGNVGKLGFLPIEICNNIYTFLLAEFKASEFEMEDLAGFPASFVIRGHLEARKIAQHSIDTAILRTSRDVYREAYDLMVKKNRFVRVTSQGVPQFLLNAAPLTFVTTTTDHVKNFRGYVLEVVMSFPHDQVPDWWNEAHDAFDAMVLADDLEQLCSGLKKGDLFIRGFKHGCNLTLDLGHLVTARCETRDFEDFPSLELWLSSQKTQKELVKPFYDALKDLENIQLSGLVSADVSKFFSKRTASSELNSPQKFLSYIEAQMEIGEKQLAFNKSWLATNTWTKGLCEMDMLREGDLWPRFVQQGGEDFVSSFAHRYFLLNIACSRLYVDAVGDSEAVARLVANFLERARMATSPGRWKEGFTLKPMKRALSELHFSRARFLRLRGNHSDIDEALSLINEARVLFPGDPEYFAEYTESIMCWAMGTREKIPRSSFLVKKSATLEARCGSQSVSIQSH